MLDGEDRKVASAIGGEASAFGLLYDHYQPKIYRFVFIKVGRREDAEDLTHQVFVNAWQNIKSYRAQGFPFSSWLYRIARNLIVDFYRAGAKRREVTIETVEEETFAGDPKIQLAVEKNFELDRVRETLQFLKPEYQDIIAMRFVEELSVKEVAAAIGKSEGAVKVMQHRAIKALQKLLHNDETR